MPAARCYNTRSDIGQSNSTGANLASTTGRPAANRFGRYDQYRPSASIRSPAATATAPAPYERQPTAVALAAADGRRRMLIYAIVSTNQKKTIHAYKRKLRIQTFFTPSRAKQNNAYSLRPGPTVSAG